MMHLFRRKKNIAKLISVLLLVLLTAGIGVTGATISHRMKLTNQIRTPTVSTEIEEEFDPGTPVYANKTKIVKFRNTGTADIFIRVAYAETWRYQESGESVLLPNHSEGREITDKAWTLSWQADWQDGGDGWFYYKKVLKPDQVTEAVLNHVNFGHVTELSDTRYRTAAYELTFQTEAVQASREIQTAKDAAEHVFGKTITLWNGKHEISSDADWNSNKYTALVKWGGDGI